uniref:Si:ch211-137a8.4 n=1 Tax=Cynoglossus semilaevis TaxID=244447 RepID=A0A3P8WJA9_CYNSE
MAATEASAAPVVQEDGKTLETKAADEEQPKTGEGGAAAGEEAAPPQNADHASSAEPKTSFLDSFLNKSGLGKVMGGRKKKEQSTAVAEENATEGAEKEGEKEEEAATAEGGAEAEEAIEKAPENGENEEVKKAEKAKPAETKSTVRDLIRKPVAKIFSHRSTEKKDGAAAEPQKQIKVRSKSLDRLQDPEALNTTVDSTTEEGGATGEAEGGAEGDQKASTSSASTKHVKRWHSFKKMMAQKTHKKSSAGGEDGKDEEGGEGGGRDSSTLDSKESGQKKWKLKRSWTFQGLKRDPSMVGISGKAKSSDKDAADTSKPEEGAEKESEKETEKAEGGEEEKAAGGGTVTHHANEIWTNFKKRVIPKSKRASTECAPSGEEDAAEGAAEDGKDGKSAKAKRSHFGRAVSLKNFIMRKGKATSVDLGEGAKEEEEEATEAGEATEEGTEKTTTETPVTPVTPVTNGENGCSNGTAEEDATHNHQEEEKTTESSPVKKTKEVGGVKEETNAQIINSSEAVISGELEFDNNNSDPPPKYSSCKDGETNNKHQQGAAALTNNDSNNTKHSPQGELEVDYSREQEEWVEEEEEEMRKRGLREAAVAIVHDVMSAATDQLEKELGVSEGVDGSDTDNVSH